MDGGLKEKKMNINIEIKGQQAHIVNQQSLISGTSNLEEIKFDFSSEWNGYTKTAVIYVDDYSISDSVKMLVEKDVVSAEKLPDWLFREECELYIGVFGDNSEGRRITSTIVCQKVKKGVPVDVVNEITPDIYNQIIKIMCDAKALVKEADEKIEVNKGYLEQAEQKANDAADYADRAGNYLEEVVGQKTDVEKLIANIDVKVEESTTNIANITEAKMNDISSLTEAKSNDIATLTTAKLGDINNTAQAQIESINTVANQNTKSGIEAVNAAARAQIGGIETVANAQKKGITETAQGKIKDINNIATSQIDAINKTAQSQAQAIEKQGNEILEEITGQEIVNSLEEINNSMGDYIASNNPYYAYLEDRKIGTLLSTEITKVRNYGLIGRKSLIAIDLPKCTNVGSYAFQDCTALSNVNLPECVFVSMYAFADCEKLQNVNIPKCTRINSNTFESCKFLKKIELNLVETISYEAFWNCNLLECVKILNTKTVCALANKNALSGTKIESGNGYIYVPDNLIEQYKTATNWSVYANQIKPLSEYTE